jgi:hypothetical protein
MATTSQLKASLSSTLFLFFKFFLKEKVHLTIGLAIASFLSYSITFIFKNYLTKMHAFSNSKMKTILLL